MVDKANQRVRGLADMKYYAAGRLPIVFAKIAAPPGKLPAGGYTVKAYTATTGAKIKSDWLPWCLVDPSFKKNEVLLHETGHAAGAEHRVLLNDPIQEMLFPGSNSPPEDYYDLMCPGVGDSPVTISKETVGLLTSAYFCW